MKRLLATLFIVLLAGVSWQVFTVDLVLAQEGTPVPQPGEAVQAEPVEAERVEAGPVEAGPGEAVPGDGASSPPDEGVADPEASGIELTDDEIRELLSKNSIDGFTSHWKRRRGYLNSKTCGDYHRLDGPTVYCEAAEVPDELVQEYREPQKNLRSTFLNEETPEF
ncbi:MAG: hypothetical protein HKN28_00615 [Alphaproteobacteria bacterium]|nr:hypothetical protein [Alphaproteobacteria bacterium]